MLHGIAFIAVQHSWEFCLFLPVFPFVRATSINLLRLLDPEGEGSVTLGKVNNYLLVKTAHEGLPHQQHCWENLNIFNYLESSSWRFIQICITFIPASSLLWTTSKWLYFAENHFQKREHFLECLWRGSVCCYSVGHLSPRRVVSDLIFSVDLERHLLPSCR